MKKEKNYDFKKIEKKWQNAWEKKKVFQVKESSKKKKFYCLEMFPYPSGSGLHMGHALNYSIGDVYSRFKRMRGFNVLYPMGFDSFGLPAENAAIKAKEHPKKYAEKSIRNFIKQMKEIGLSYDWSRTLKTSDSEYYKWNQLFFLKFLENGLVYRKKASVNFCRKCNTVLANEQVHNGMCWRHTDTEVEIKQLEQWFIKTTKYADELLKCVDGLNWPNRIKIMQKNWIGKSYGTEIEFEIDSKISKVVLMHGKDTNPDEKWYLWFGNEVKRKGIEYIAPVLPDSHDPEIGAWLKKLDETDPDENTILVGHSRGGVSILRWLEKLPKGKRVKKVVLVAANAGDSKKRNKTENNKGFFSVKGYDFEKIKSHCDSFVVIHSREDHLVPFSDGEENAKGLNAKFSIYENKGHFGKHVGKECEEILDEVFEKWPIFTTRLDTIFGTTFMVVSAQHPRLKELVTKEQKINVDKFLKKVRSTSEKDADILEKEGVFTGSYAINPVNNEKVPVYVGNFVLADYGSGMVMAVPAHDQRDFEFAKKYKIPVKQVIRKEKHPVRSYLMGAKKITKNDLTKLDIKIIEKTKTGNFKIEIPKNKLKDYEKLIIKKMENGFWNEYIGEEIVFIFKFNDGKIKRLVLNQDTEEEIDKLASEFMKDENWNKSCVWKWLAENGFYTDLIVHTDFGVLVNSGAFNGLKSSEAKEHIIKFLENKKFGKKTVNYKLRDWLVSRQRYWGTPIPIVYCDKCGIVAVKEKDLPVKLPEKVKFGKGNPLTTSKSFLEVKCSECKGKARRETDTMDTFFDSSWYFLRYPDSKNNKKPFDVKKENYWMPVDQYIGGAEHACMHLIYARFFTKALRDLGFFGKKKIDEPFTNLFNQGMLHKGGKVMAKSVGNVVVPEEVSKKYGIDTARLFLMSVASPDKDIEWSEKGIEGSLKFMKKVISYFDKVKIGKTDNKTESRLNKTIKEVTLDIEGFNYNLAIIKIRDLFNSLPEAVGKKTLEDSLKLLHPFCPHITEELWKKIGGKGFISLASWPKADEKKIDSKLEEQEEAVDKISEDINHVVKIVKDKGKKVDKVFIYVLPNEKKIYKNSVSYISKKTNLKATVFGVNDKDKYDPENKSKKVKPGRPGIYLE